MSRHWYRNDELNQNKLFSEECVPEGFSKEAYSQYQSQIQSGENHPNFGKQRPKEVRAKIRESNLGKVVSKETREKQSHSAKNRERDFHPNHEGKNNPNYGRRYSLSEETYNSFQAKRNATLKRNNTYNKSKPEEDFYIKLLERFDAEDIVRQYKSKVYPFKCDFYIKSIDKYIECNFHWTHGSHPFDENNLEDILKLKQWQEKALQSKFYANAIKTWTQRDVEKQRVAKENNLNIEFIY